MSRTDPVQLPAVLIVEDDPTIGHHLHLGLEGHGYPTTWCRTGAAALIHARENRPGIVLLDLGLPDLDGVELARTLRRDNPDILLVILTARSNEIDVIVGLDAGADDYLVKPFSTDELLARVRALLRRTKREGRSTERLEFDDVKVDLIQQRAWRGKTELHLTAKEFSMLRLLADSQGEPVSRERFLDVVWGYAAFPTTRTVDNHVASLRSKIEKDADDPKWIKTVHGVGYRLEMTKA
jgi:DNA-binding response OmpR family regulator